MRVNPASSALVGFRRQAIDPKQSFQSLEGEFDLPAQSVENIRMNLQHVQSGNEITLEFDDLSGETLEQAFATRYCPEKFVELVKSAEGMLLFLSANRKNDDAVTILDVFDAEEDATQPAADPSHWEPKECSIAGPTG